MERRPGLPMTVHAAGKWEERKWELIGILGKALVNALFATIRVESQGQEKVRAILESRRFIFAFWHSRILLISYLYQGWGGVILVSASKDGEYMARVLKRQGHYPVRGSTSKGGLRALAQQIRHLRMSPPRPAVVVPDGPQGPRFRAQPGVVLLAQKTGYPIVPVTYSARRMKVFSSWDRFILPFPFTVCKVVYGNPVSVPADADAAILGARLGLLERELRRVTFEADRAFGHCIDG